jgi:hypothetical protein
MNEEEDNLSFICPSTAVIVQRCLPPIPSFLRDNIANGDQAWFDALDNQSEITSSCNDIIIRISDSDNLTSGCTDPKDCSEMNTTVRTIQIFDGPTSVVQECVITYQVEVPYYLERCSFPPNLEVSCEDDVEAEFKLWIDNLAYTEFSEGCLDIRQDVDADGYVNPSDYVIDYRVLPGNNPNGCDPGNGFLRAQFWLIDECGHTMTSIAEFTVRDNVPPTFTNCPDDFVIDIGATDLLADIQAHIDSAVADDNCSQDVLLSNNWDETQVSMEACDEQVFRVLTAADDQCGNTTTSGNSCETLITITNSGNISIDCPADTLRLTCGDPTNQTQFDNWRATVRAIDFAGRIINNIANNFSVSEFSVPHCNTEFTVNFVATDVCSRTTNCMQLLTISDNTPPVTAGCPGPLTVNAADATIVDDVNNWLSTWTATDECLTTIIPMNDLDPSILNPDCGSRDVLIQFWADDNCNPIDSSCTATLSIIDNVVSAFANFPADTIIECSTNPNIADLSAWVAQATAGNNLGATFTVQNDLAFNNPNLSRCDSVVDVRVFFVDQCGQEVDRIAQITVADTEAPQITCPPDQTFNADATPDITADITNWIGSAVLTDNCGLQPVIENYQPQAFAGCDEIITNPITFLAEDECGNFSDPCIAMLTIEAMKRPSISCPNNLTMECGDTTNVDQLAAWLDGALATSVLGDTLAHINNFDANSLELISCGNEVEVQFIITDNCGFTETCMSTVRVEDTTRPNVTCPPTITVNSTDLNIDAAVRDWIATVMFDDNGCLGPAIFNDYDASLFVACDQAGPLDITFTVTDQCGLSTSCIGRVMINQDIPQIVCPDGTLRFECGDPANEMLINDWIDSASAMDNSGFVETVTNDFDFAVIDSTCNQTVPINFLVIDTCGRENNCTTNLILTDSQPPIYINGCPDPLSLLSGSPVDNKNASFQDWINAIFIDDCNGFTLSYDFDPQVFTVDCDDITFDVAFTLVDDCGWIANDCNSQIIITNNIDATLTCAQPLSVECADPNNEMLIRDWLDTASAQDNLGNSFDVNDDFTFSNPDLIQCSGTIPVEFTMVNICGDSQMCNANITITDTTDPVITCPQPIMLVLESPTFTADVDAWLASATAEDNCISNLTFSDTYQEITTIDPCDREEVVNVTFAAADGCGNNDECTVLLTVMTNQGSILNCPASDLTIECADPDNVQLINTWLNSTEGIDADGSMLNVTPDYNPADVNAIEDCTGSVPITFEMTDNCGTTATCMSNINVEDTTRPTAICPPDITINSTDVNAVDLANDWIMANSATDNCSMASASVENGFFIPVTLCNSDETRLVEFYAQDVCGLRDTCRSLLTINQDAPIINCPGDVAVQCGADDVDSVIDAWLDSFSGMDNSGEPLTVDDDFMSITLNTMCESTLSVNFEIMDNCGRPTTCVQNIIQRDTLAPVITNCPQSIEIDVASADLFSQIESWLASYTAVDACNPAGDNISNNYDLQIEQFDCGDMQDVMFFAEDACGNIDSTCVANIDVFNNLEVEITCPEPISVICNDATTDRQVTDFLNGAEVSSLDTFEIDTDLLLADMNTECTSAFTQEIVFTATDRCGNTDECTGMIFFVPKASLYIPTIFRPGGTGVDRFYMVRSNVAITTIESMRIYSRWGDLMYERENFDPNVEEGWDGLDRLGNSVQGVYTYHIRYRDIDDNEFEHIGTLTLIE